MYKTGHSFSYLLLKESVANDVINVSLFAEPVFFEPRHRRMEASSVGLCRCWRQTFWTLLMIAALKITMSKWHHCKFDNWRWLDGETCCYITQMKAPTAIHRRYCSRQPCPTGSTTPPRSTSAMIANTSTLSATTTSKLQRQFRSLLLGLLGVPYVMWCNF